MAMKKSFLVWLVVVVLILGGSVVAAQGPVSQEFGPDKINLSGLVPQGFGKVRIVYLDCFVTGHQEPVDDTIPYIVTDGMGIVLDRSSFRVKGGAESRPIAVPWNASNIYADINFLDQISDSLVYYDGSVQLPSPPRYIWDMIWVFLNPPHVKVQFTRYVMPNNGG